MIRLENAEKHYKQFDLACSLQVKPGQITGLIGENGAGKSTTLKPTLEQYQTLDKQHLRKNGVAAYGVMIIANE